MSKEKSPFEKTAAALKIMGKKISAKKGSGSNILKCVFGPNRKGNPKATRNKLLNSKMRSIYGRKWPKMKKRLKNMTVIRLKDFNDIKDRRFLEFPMTHSAIVELAPGEI